MSRKWKKAKKLLPSRIEASALKNFPKRLDICGASGDFQILAAEGDGDKKLRKFSMTAYTGVAMRIGGFSSPVVVDLSAMQKESDKRPILFSHDVERIVGHSEAIEVSEQRLKLTGVVSGIGDDATKVSAMAENGYPWQASIGADIDELNFVERGQSVKVNGRNFKGPLYVAKTTLKEVSFVPIGADSATSAKIAATQQNRGEPTMFEQWLEAEGYDAEKFEDFPEKTKAKIKARYEDEQKPPAKKDLNGKSQDVDDLIAKRRKEDARIADIRELIDTELDARSISADDAEVVAKEAIKAGWTKDQTELSLLRLRREALPFVVTPKKPIVDSNVVEAALCRTAQLPNLEKQFGEKTLEASHRVYPNGLGLHEIIAICARRNGWRGESVKVDLRGALKYAAMSPEDRGVKAYMGPSTYDLSGLLSNVANKFLRLGWDSVDTAWREISDIASASDFKEMTTYSLTGDLVYEKLAPGGEIKHGTLDELEYTNKIETYSKMLGIDRRDLINDNLGALQSATRRLGRGGALALNQVFWTEFMDNGSFFTSALGNFDDGTDSEFDEDGLESANLLFLNQTDPDGQPISVTPKILLVPNALAIKAKRLINSTQLLEANAEGDANPWANSFRIVSSPYLSNSAITGYSAKKWYLIADPNDLPVIQVAFLNGRQAPVVETADMDFDRLGILMRAYHDFGVRKQEHRAGVAMKGEA